MAENGIDPRATRNLIVIKLLLQWTISHVVAACKFLLSRSCFESLDKKCRWKCKKCGI